MSAQTTAESNSSYRSTKNPVFEACPDENNCQAYHLGSLTIARDNIEFNDTPDSSFSTEDSIFNHNSSEDILYATPAPRINAKVPFFQAIMNALFMMYHG